MNKQRVVDARGLAPPEPMELTLEALDTLGEDEELLLLLHREPYPLYTILQRNRYTHFTRLREDGTFEILIKRAS